MVIYHFFESTVVKFFQSRTDYRFNPDTIMPSTNIPNCVENRIVSDIKNVESITYHSIY